MRPPRSSIAAVMAAVAAVAINLAVARVVLAPDPGLVIGAALPCLALQGAALRLIRRRGRARAFWVGFTLFGSLLTASFFWAMLFPEVLGITRTGALIRTPGSPLYTVWMAYARLVDDRIGPWLSTVSAAPYGAAPIAFRALVWSLPQLLAASIGGLVACGVSAVVRSRSRAGDPGQPPPHPAEGVHSLSIEPTGIMTS